MAKFLVTGGLGFIGSNLTQALLQQGHEVWVLDNLQENLGGNTHNLPAEFLQKNWIRKDISDPKVFEGVEANFDVIYHCSSQTSHIDSMTEPFLDMHINVGGAINVALSAAKHSQKPHVIYAGTRAQLGKPETYPVTEKTIGHPTDVYGVHKQTAEGILELYAKNKGYKFTSLIVTNCYGQRHQMKHPKFGVLNWFIRLAMDESAISIYGDGAQKREYLFVDDVVEAFLAAQKAPQALNKYIIGAADAISVRESAELIVRIAGTGRVELTPWPADRKAIETGDWVTDMSKVKTELGWKPKTSFEDGLKKTISFYNQHKRNYW